jgi:hypothetical protein
VIQHSSDIGFNPLSNALLLSGQVDELHPASFPNEILVK